MIKIIDNFQYTYLPVTHEKYLDNEILKEIIRNRVKRMLEITSNLMCKKHTGTECELIITGTGLEDYDVKVNACCEPLKIRLAQKLNYTNFERGGQFQDQNGN